MSLSAFISLIVVSLVASKDNSSDKVIDLEAYRYKKLSKENINLQNQITQILLAGKSLIASQKRILKSSLRILNT